MMNAGNRLGSAYSLAAKGCMCLLRMWVEAGARQPPVNIVFETGCALSGDLRKGFAEERQLGALTAFGDIVFRAKREWGLPGSS